MGKEKRIISYVIYVVVLIVYILTLEKLNSALTTIDLASRINPILIISIYFAENLIFGGMLGTIHLINEFFKKKRPFKFDFLKALIIGLPCFILGTGIYIYYGTDILKSVVLYDYFELSRSCCIVCGFIVVSAFKRTN